MLQSHGVELQTPSQTRQPSPWRLPRLPFPNPGFPNRTQPCFHMGTPHVNTPPPLPPWSRASGTPACTDIPPESLPAFPTEEFKDAATSSPKAKPRADSPTVRADDLALRRSRGGRRVGLVLLGPKASSTGRGREIGLSWRTAVKEPRPLPF